MNNANMNEIEKTIKSERIYEGKILNLRIDTVELPNRKYSRREIIEHQKAVAIIPVDDDGNIYLVKQYRKAINKEIYEIPAGLVENNEALKETAIRELQEEIGYTTENLEYLFDAYSSPGFTDEKVSLFLARSLQPSKLKLDEDEFLTVHTFQLPELVKLVEDCVIVDAKTIIGILFLKNYFRDHPEIQSDI